MDINQLACYYVSTVAKMKRYNLQSIAIKKFIGGIDKREFIDNLSLDVSEFNMIYDPFIARDIIFKNNSLVTRKTLLVNPEHYYYYTKLVFDMLLNENIEEREYCYKHTNLTAYYSGVLFKNIKPNDNKQARKILFDNSYNKFQENLLSYEGKQGMSIDLSSFFDSIMIDNLIAILYSKYNHSKVSKLENFFKSFNLKNLPQFHYSIASSLLSQEYISEFDNELNNLLIEKNFDMIRFVDDMYFFNNGELLQEKDFHILLDKINNLLWKNHLNMNPTKTDFFIDTFFERSLVKSSYNGDERFRPEERIEEKAESLIKEDFVKFVQEVNLLYEQKGHNVKEFTSLFESTFSIHNGDARKVLNNFVYGDKWKEIEDEKLKYIVSNFQFVFYLPDIFFALYLKVYSYIESKYGRDEGTIRELLTETDRNSGNSLRYIYSSLYYLIQRRFKRRVSIRKIQEFDEALGEYITRYIERNNN